MRKLGAAALLVVAGACKPQVRGQCVENSDCRAGSVCGPQHICLDLTAPAISIQVMTAPDSVNGWFPRTADNVEVRATTTDGAGSGVSAPSATLTLDACPTSVPCSYEGVPLVGAGPGVFSFQVPRYAQAAGVERALPFTVSVADNVGNKGTGHGVLQIDDAPPAIGTPFLVTAGTVGEDGQLWFNGGSGAADVEIAIPVSDSGSGVASLTLQLANGDVVAGTPLDVPAVVPRAADGSFHFKLPASAVQGREGSLRFSLVAMDVLQHAASRAGDPRDLIWVDALPPSIALAKVDYANVFPTAPDCGVPDAVDFKCGRQAGTHLLRDDTALMVTFDAFDCGAGVAATAQFSAAIRSGGQTKFAPALTQSVLPGGKPCTSGNRSPNPIHRFSFALDLMALAPVLDPPDATGTSIVRIDTSGKDLLAHAATAAAPSTATSGQGLALVSWWRWKRQLTGNVTGSPALFRVGTLDPAGARRIAVGTDATVPGTNNVLVLNADGSVALAVPVPGGPPSDVAVGATNLLYLTTNSTAVPCPGSNCGNGTLAVIRPASTPNFVTCLASGAVVGTAPAVITLGTPGAETAVAAAQAHSGTANLFFFTDGASACTPSGVLVNAPSDFKGVTATQTSIFMADTSGFSSLDQSSGSFSTSTLASYNGTVTSPAAPAIAPAPAASTNLGPDPIFGGDATDHTVRRTYKTNCGAVLTTPCWQTDTTTFNDPNAGRAASGLPAPGLPFTPVFDGTNIWTTDAIGNVYAWNQTTGKPMLTTTGLGVGGKASPPVLLAGGNQNKALVVTPDGTLSIVDAARGTAIPLGNGGAAGTDAPQVAPVLDVRSASQTGIAYVAGPSKWLYAWQIPYLPLAASSTAWPRPGRDSCNSRNASDPCP